TDRALDVKDNAQGDGSSPLPAWPPARRSAKPARELLLGRLDLLEPHEVVLLEELLLARLLEAGRLDLLHEDLLAGTDVAQHPVRTLPLHPVEINQDDLAARLEGPADGGHRLLGELEVVVGVADEGQIDRPFR